MSFFKSTWYWPLLSLFGNSESIDSPFCCHLLICLHDRSTEYLKVISLGLLQCYQVHRRHSGDKWARYWTSLCARILASRGSTLPLPRAGRYAVPWPPCWQTMELPFTISTCTCNTKFGRKTVPFFFLEGYSFKPFSFPVYVGIFSSSPRSVWLLCSA